MAAHHLEVQIASNSNSIPTLEEFRSWVDTVLMNQPEACELVIRVVDEPEMSELNEIYRHKIGPTNILSFPFEKPQEFALESDLIGDLVICAPVLAKEAAEQGKRLEHHWAHIVVHGILHLLGYDHVNEVEAEEMEALEVNILLELQIRNPYQEQ